MEILLGISIGIILTVGYTVFMLWRWTRQAEAVAQTVMLEASRKLKFRCEWADPHLLVFDSQDRFVAQGRTLRELRDRFTERFGDRFECMLSFKDLPEEVRSRLSAESQEP